FYNFLFRGTGLFFGFLTSILIARLLGPEKLGEYSLAFWILTIAGLFVNLGLPTTVTRYLSESAGRKDLNSAGQILTNSFRWIFRAGILVTVLLFFFSPAIANFYHKPYLSIYLKIGSLGIIPMGLLAIYMAAFEGFLRFDLVAFLTFILSPVTFLLILLALVFKGEVEYLLWVSVISNFLGVLLYFNFYHLKKYPYVREPLSKDLKFKLVTYSKSIFVILLLEVLLWERFELLFLGAYSSENQIAFYNLGFNLASKVILLLPGALTGILLPTMSEAYGGGQKERLIDIHRHSSRYIALIAIPLCVGGVFLAPRIITGIYGAEYMPSAIIFSIVLLAGVFGSISRVSVSFLYSLEKQKTVLLFYVLSVFLKLLLNLSLTRRYQAIGAVWVNFSAQVFFGLGVIFYVYAFLLKRRFPFIQILKISFASCVMGVLVYFFSLFLPGISGSIVCILIGVISYPVLLALIRVWESIDFELGSRYIKKLPPGMNTLAGKFLEVMKKLS
ncbi:MAG: flippase, partial [candidate division Zixibacteria bacterium]|nr:flippase [candidate division Zixibacteria bacterium]